MIVVAVRRLGIVALVAPAALAAQVITSPRPGGSAPALPSHVEQQLWPERELSPVEQELKQHVLTIGDSLRRVEAIAAQIERQHRGNASVAVLRSAGRSLAADCGRAARTSTPVSGFAATLSTSDTRWGDPAVRSWRAALDDLRSQMSACEQRVAAQVAGNRAFDVGPLAEASANAAAAVRRYRWAEEGLLRTLKINIDPRRRHG